MGSNATSYKQMKEDFVSNLTGGSVTEINNVVTVGPVCETSNTSTDAHIMTFLLTRNAQLDRLCPMVYIAVAPVFL